MKTESPSPLQSPQLAVSAPLWHPFPNNKLCTLAWMARGQYSQRTDTWGTKNQPPLVTIEFYNGSDTNTFAYGTSCVNLKLATFVEVLFSKTLSSDTVVTCPRHSPFCFVRDKPLQLH
jgi:hypothetical protein